MRCTKNCCWTETLLSKYNVGRTVLGAGTYGCVHLGEDKNTKKLVAIKRVTDIKDSSTSSKNILREMSLLRMMNGHPNFISLESVQCSESLNDIYLVFEYCYRNLSLCIESKAEVVDTVRIQSIVYQILCGIHYLHSAKLVHRDLKPANILINATGQVKIADLGLSRAVQTSGLSSSPVFFNVLTPYVVTRWYRSPEVILFGDAQAPADMWSIGCILAELFLRKPLFPGCSTLDMLNLMYTLIGTPDPSTLEDCSTNSSELCFTLLYPKKSAQINQQSFPGADELLLDLLAKLLVFDPSKRITAQEALLHPFFATIYDSSDVMSFTNKAGTEVDAFSLHDYYQYEYTAETATRTEKIQSACALIQKEANRYAALDEATTCTAGSAP